MKQPLGEWGEQEHEARLGRMIDQAQRQKWFDAVLGIVIGGVSVYLCLTWFDWKLLVVIFLAMFGNNLSQK
jgi:muramoyltetrapeptide carboxypeptidase LdcA involved in peptidoglycan recycling